MTRMGVLGVGTMGLPIARRLAERFAVSVFDPDPVRLGQAERAGLVASDSESALARSSELLVAVLPGAAEQRRVLLGSHDRPGVVGMSAEGATLIDLTSGDPAAARALAREAEKRGCGYVSAPMGGGPREAASGALRFFVSGAGDAVTVAAEALRGLHYDDHDLVVVGEDAGAALVAKLAVNAIWFGQAVLVGEAMLAGAAAGVDPETMRRLLAGSAADSAFVRDSLPSLLEGDYLATFGLDRVVEELDAFARLARTGGAGEGMLGASRALHAEALARYGPVKGELLGVRLLEEIAGRDLRRVPPNVT